MLFKTSLLLGLAALSSASPIIAGQQYDRRQGVGSGGDGSNATVPSAISGYMNHVYFVNWGIYGRNFQPQQLPAEELTHVLYAFANIQADGTVFLSDTYADLQKHYPTDSWNDVGNNVYGCIKQLYILKKHNRQLKVLMSIGGWTYSTNFAALAASPDTRAKFASTAVQFVRDLGLDGIDIDWEYPADDTQAGNFVLLLQALRQAMDAYAVDFAPGYHFLITVACPAGPSHYSIMHLKDMDQYVDVWNLMTYDYSGSWDSNAGHDANLYTNSANPTATPFNTQQAVSDYVAAGIPTYKIVLGMPLYGRSFEQTTGIGATYNGIGSGSWENGVWDYKVLPKAGAQMMWDNVAQASYSYDPSTQELISFDTPAETKLKGQYIQAHGLGGAMFWEASGDRNDSGSLISTMNQVFGRLETNENWLSYLGSQYDNMVSGMPGE